MSVPSVLGGNIYQALRSIDIHVDVTTHSLGEQFELCNSSPARLEGDGLVSFTMSATMLSYCMQMISP